MASSSKTSICLLLIAVFSNPAWVAASQQSFYQCARNPEFVRSAGMTPPVAIDTQQSLLPGVVVREMRGQKRMYRHPTWEQTGNVGSTVRDELGNIYAVPIPSVGLDTNPLDKRTNVYRINSTTGEMELFAKLPSNDAPTQRNPFGTMGIAYDCSTRSLYVSSVADSKPREQHGGLYKIDVQTRKVTPVLEQWDAIGVDVFDPGDGKRLYFGDARSSSVFSVPLGPNTSAIDRAPKHEFSLLELKNGNSTQIRKIRFVPDEEHQFKMVVTDTEFAFRLLADTSKRFRHYEFIYDPSKAGWKFLQIR